MYSKDVLALVDFPTHVQAIKDKAMQAKENGTLTDIDQIYSRQYNLDGSSLEEQIEKVAILTHLYSREMQNFVNFNQDEHKESKLV